MSHAQARTRVTITLQPAILAAIDAATGRKGGLSRSRQIEEALRDWCRREAAEEIELAVARYYRERTRKEADEDKAWARASGRAARKVWRDK